MAKAPAAALLWLDSAPPPIKVLPARGEPHSVLGIAKFLSARAKHHPYQQQHPRGTRRTNWDQCRTRMGHTVPCRSNSRRCDDA